MVQRLGGVLILLRPVVVLVRWVPELRRVALWVKVDDEHLLAFPSQRGGRVDCDGRLGGTTFVVVDADAHTPASAVEISHRRSQRRPRTEQATVL
eukprot:scaffold33364_cov146-Isochrysis_galbana.AAC.7